MREPLPQRRQSDTFKFRFGGQNAAYHLTIGYYPDGKLGEVFISTNKIGSQSDALARDIAILMSLALQHGCAMETMRDALTREANGEPSTIAGSVADILAPKPEGAR
jgi:hypothetical protein